MTETPRTRNSILPALGLTIATLATAHPLSAQEPVPVRFSGTPVTAAHEFSSITAIRELSDGRVLVTDNRDKELRLFDRQLATSRTIGRIGNGPKEFGIAGALFPLAGDTTLLLDGTNARYLPIHPDGSLGETIPMSTESGASNTRTISSGLSGTAWVDHRRRACTLQRVFMAMPGTARPDSAALECGPMSSAERRTVAQLKQPALQPVESGSSSMRIMQTVRFDTQDGWAVSPEGNVAVVRSVPYRVEWLFADRAPVIGPAMPFTPIQVTREETERANAAFREQMASQGSGTSVVGPDGQRRSPDAALAKAALPSRDVKPAFEATMTVAGPDNTVWVRRHVVDGREAVYDVFDARGRRIHSVEMPPRRIKVIGVGRHGVYLVRIDDDGLQYLERWNRPS